MLTLDQIRSFVAVAEELHFGRAAERLQMTQPPLSRQIQKLEQSVGARLLNRDNRSVSLTPAGRAFLIEAGRLLALADSAAERARRVSEGAVGTVRLGFTASAASRTLLQILDAVASAHPRIAIDLLEMVSSDQIEALQSGEIDLGLARPPFDTEMFASRLLCREDMVVAVPDGHRLTRLDHTVTAADIAGEPLIAYSPEGARYFYDMTVRIIPQAQRHVVHTVSQILTASWLVAGGRGIALVPESARDLHIDGVTHLPLHGLTQETAELHLLWHRASPNPALTSVLAAVPVSGPPLTAMLPR